MLKIKFWRYIYQVSNLKVSAHFIKSEYIKIYCCMHNTSMSLSIRLVFGSVLVLHQMQIFTWKCTCAASSFLCYKSPYGLHQLGMFFLLINSSQFFIFLFGFFCLFVTLYITFSSCIRIRYTKLYY